MSALTTSIQHYLENLHNQWGKKEKETIFDKKNYHFVNNIIFYVADPFKSIKQKAILINK
jgi:hypothetical protein